MRSRIKDFSLSMPLDCYFDGDDGSTERDEELRKQILAYKTDPLSHIPNTYLEDDVKNAGARRMNEVLRTPPWMPRVDVPPSVNERLCFKVKSPSEGERVPPSVKDLLGASLVNLEWLSAEEPLVFCHQPRESNDLNLATREGPMEEDKQILDLGLTAEEEADCDDEYLKMKTNEPQSHTPVSLGNDPPLPSPNPFGRVLRTPSRCVNTNPVPEKGSSKETKSDNAETGTNTGPVSGSGEHYPEAWIDKAGEYETEADAPRTSIPDTVPVVVTEDKSMQHPRLVITVPERNAPHENLPLSPLTPMSSNDEEEDKFVDLTTPAKLPRTKSKVSKAKGKNKENKEKRDLGVGASVAGSQSASGVRRTRSMTRSMQ
ncbi:hypothetical protein R3P38DRAFT_2794945 [Favolaschia claudopus]|uniref:Uncharacterized protein n=1 Tax=Favolaschia claudopus TaxID=2862362 RepID=A0AAW0A854_9AGAR